MCRINLNSKPCLKLVGLKLKTLGELLAVATETEAALKDHKKEKSGLRSEGKFRIQQARKILNPNDKVLGIFPVAD